MRIFGWARQMPVDKVGGQLPTVTPPSFPGSEPRIRRPEAGGERDSWDQAELARHRAETELMTARGEAEIRDRDERRAAEERRRDRRLAADIANERWERLDRRIQLCGVLAIFLFVALQPELRPPDLAVTLSVLVGLLVRAVSTALPQRNPANDRPRRRRGSAVDR